MRRRKRYVMVFRGYGVVMVERKSFWWVLFGR